MRPALPGATGVVFGKSWMRSFPGIGLRSFLLLVVSLGVTVSRNLDSIETTISRPGASPMPRIEETQEGPRQCARADDVRYDYPLGPNRVLRKNGAHFAL
jgi:hypothetical protein